MTAIFVFDTAMYDSDIWMDYPKTSEKWNLTAKFNCLQAIYFYASGSSALAVPMCGICLVFGCSLELQLFVPR